MLPPLENEDRREMTEIEKSNVLSLQIMADSRLLADGKPLELAQLRKKSGGVCGKCGRQA